MCCWNPSDYYSLAMLGLKMDQEVLGELVKTKAPAVGQLMAQYPGIWTLVVSRWFICLYIDILPIEVRKSTGLTPESTLGPQVDHQTGILHVPLSSRRS